jgi:hypothetical protein
MGFIRIDLTYPDEHPNSNLKSRRRTAALIDNEIELSYWNLVEKKRSPLSAKPNSNSNPGI